MKERIGVPSVPNLKYSYEKETVLDKEWLEKITQDGTGLLFDKHIDKPFREYIFKVACKFLNETEAEEASQEILVKIFEKLHTFTPKDTDIKTWIYNLTKNFCIDKQRKKTGDRTILLPNFDSHDPEDDTEEKIENDEQKESLLNFIANELKRHNLTLKDIKSAEDIEGLNNAKDSELYILLRKYYLGEKISKIATSMNKKMPAIKMQLMRAKERMRLAYKDNA